MLWKCLALFDFKPHVTMIIVITITITTVVKIATMTLVTTTATMTLATTMHHLPHQAFVRLNVTVIVILVIVSIIRQFLVCWFVGSLLTNSGS